MDRKEAVSVHQSVQDYIQNHKLRPMFQELTRELLLHRPSDPLEHLIRYLGHRTRRLTAFLTGGPTQTEIAAVSANKLNFKHIDAPKLFSGVDMRAMDDRTVSEAVIAEVKKVDAGFKGVIVSGFPNNFAQLDRLQKSGLDPDRYFYVEGEGDSADRDRI